ncbi:MAG: SURF1 family protein [Micromonosporaceae bacterium]|nr:SURF1 family protein [Micromonosporaceae bacterium]
MGGYRAPVSTSPSTPPAATPATGSRYAFLRRPSWIALIVVAVTLASVMVGLGFWQLSRYHERTAINDRVEAAGRAAPRPVTDVLSASRNPSEQTAWTRVTVTGRYDSEHEILVRGRTVSGRVGYEVLTPLVLPGGTAVLVDRGWIPPGEGGAASLPDVPPAPDGEVTLVGRVHLPESSGDTPAEANGALQSRRVDPARIAPAVPYPLLRGYILVQKQTPAADERFTPIPVRYEDPGQNLSYLVQWWLFATIALVGTGFLARREARRLGPAAGGEGREARQARDFEGPETRDERTEARRTARVAEPE